MKLKQNQLALIRHLAQFETLDYQSCLMLLDEQKTNDKIALSYDFRPLTKNKYIVKHKDDSVNILAKGRALFQSVNPLVTLGGGTAGIKRVNSISRTAMYLYKVKIEIVASPKLTEYECFVPSTCWRKIRTGILSTARFTGMLFTGKHCLAVYDIGDGTMDWQLRAERSLFYYDISLQSTSATGLLLICDDDKRIEIAKQIIRETMRQRKRLIEHESYEERTRPLKFSKVPIKLAYYYLHVYLATPETLEKSIGRIRAEKENIRQLRGSKYKCDDEKSGDYEENGNYWFINITTDLLKYVYFFTAVKSTLESSGDSIGYSIVVAKEDVPILQMYPKIMEKGVNTYVYKYSKDFG